MTAGQGCRGEGERPVAPMSLLVRLLGLRPPEPVAPSPESPRTFKFEPDQVRVLLFRECERTDTRLLYDSSSVQKVERSRKTSDCSLNRRRKSQRKDSVGTPAVVEVSHDVEFKPKDDIGIISEMIFGSVAMNFKGLSFKVHILNSPQRLMCAKVFKTSSRRYRTRTISSNHDSSACVKNLSSGNHLTLSERTPSTDDHSSFSWSLNKDDSGFYCDFSSQSSINSYMDFDSFTSTWDQDDGIDQPEHSYYFGYSNLAESSNVFNSIKWKLNHSISTNLGSSNVSSRNSDSACSAQFSDSQLSNSFNASTNESSTSGRRGKLGLAILINLTEKSESQMLQFLMEHIILLESTLDRLRLCIHKYYYEPNTFISKMFQATEEISKWFVDIFTRPHFKMPMWIELSGSRLNNQLADQFLMDLSYLLNCMDTKDTYFFMSTLITNVLTYHLGWVNYVSPYNIALDNRRLNPLWTQLSELYGAIGTPARIAKTLICGRQKSSKSLIERIITVLTYFIRCGNIKRSVIQSKSPSLEAVNLVMENYKSDKLPVNQSSVEDVQSDVYIEMKTFSSNATLIDSKPILKKTSSFLSKLNRNNNFVKAVDLNSTSTLIPLPIDEESLYSNRSNSEKAIFDEKHADVQIKTSKTAHQLEDFEFVNSADCTKTVDSDPEVVFMLGENEALIGIKPSITESNSIVADQRLQPPMSSKTNICYNRDCHCKHSRLKKHSGVKFEFDKYPQIVTNYMKSKNLELLDRHVIGKPGNLKIDGVEIERNFSVFTEKDNVDKCINCSLNSQILQTPSNASELEFTSDIPPCEIQYAEEKLASTPPLVCDESAVVYVRKKLDNTLVVNTIEDKAEIRPSKKYFSPNTIDLPATLISVSESSTTSEAGYYNTLLGGVSDHYISDLILQGTVSSEIDWENQIRRDLALQNRLAPGGAICLLADVDDWSVKILGSGNNCTNMSALIASMLDTLLQMQKSSVPSEQCIMFLETKLRELCMRSKTLAELLLNKDFCNMDYLTKTLNLEPNDVPLLMAIASTHTPQIALKCGISFR